MFEAKVSDLKWRVLAQFEREQNSLAYSEAAGDREKRHYYECETPFADTTFCVTTAYAHQTWQGVVVPCAKKRATRLIVRPHLRWEFPEELVSNRGGIPWLHEMFELHVRRYFSAYAGTRTHKGTTTCFVGLETIMTARDLRENAGEAVELWDRAISSYLAKSNHEELASATNEGRLQTPLPVHDGGVSRWMNGVAFQRRSLRGAAYRWQGGQPCG